MKKMKFFVLFWCLLMSANTAIAQDRAVLRKVSETVYRIEVILETPLQSGGQITAAIYSVDDNGRRIQVQKFQGTASSQSGTVGTVFDILMPRPPKEKESLIVSIFEFPAADGILNFELPVIKVLTTSLSSSSSQCPKGLELILDSRDYALEDWQSIFNYVNSYNQNPEDIAQVSLMSEGKTTNYTIRSIKIFGSPQSALGFGKMRGCISLESPVPQSNFNASINFKNSPTADLQIVKKSGLAGVASASFPKPFEDTGVPGQRGQERNLDFSGTLTSSVDEKEKNGVKVIERNTRGVFDLRLAPWLNIEPYRKFDRDRKWYRFYTPFYIDASASTSRIDKDTLSINRVVFGTEHEWRYYGFKKNSQTGNTITSPYPTFHRFILRGNHASDRDFKQLEFTGTFEYAPILGKLNHPLYLNWKFKEGQRVPGNFGYEIKPRFGFTIGKTYKRRNPAGAIKESPNVRRFHIGLDMTFNLTRYVALTVNDTLYIRGEAPDDRVHNYFKGSFEAPIGRPFENTVQSLFMSFERGNKPPFATRDANVFKLGYRIRSEGWFNLFR